MSLDLETTAADAAPVQGELLDAESSPLTLSLQDFVGEFGDELLDALNSANPPVYNGQPQAHRPWIWGMVGIQLIDLAVGAAYTASGVLPLRLSGFPMFNALWISALLAYGVWRLPAASPARGPASDAAS